MENIINETNIKLFSDILIMLVELVGGVLLAYIGKCIIPYLKSKTDKINNEAIETMINNTIDRTNDMIKDSIFSIEGTLKKEIVKDIAKGNATKEDLDVLTQEIVTSVRSKIGTEGVSILNEALGDVDKFIIDNMEMQLQTLKSQGYITPLDNQISLAKKSMEEIKTN